MLTSYVVNYSYLFAIALIQSESAMLNEYCMILWPKFPTNGNIRIGLAVKHSEKVLKLFRPLPNHNFRAWASTSWGEAHHMLS